MLQIKTAKTHEDFILEAITLENKHQHVAYLLYI